MLGLERAMAVSRRASSKVLVGLPTRGVGELPLSLGDVNVEGSIFAIIDQRFLFGVLGASAVSFGPESSMSGFVIVTSDERRFEGVGGVLAPFIPVAGCTIPSNPTKRLAAVIWLSLRIMTKRRPGAGRHGADRGGRARAFSAVSLKNRNFAQLVFNRIRTVQNILLHFVSSG